MILLDSIKALYDSSDEKILVTDDKLSVLWKNDDRLPDYVAVTDFKEQMGNAFSLPLKKTSVFHYMNGNAVKIRPLTENEEIQGYMLVFFDPEYIETLSDRSAHLKYKTNNAGNIRRAVSPVINELEKIADKNGDDKICAKAKYQLQKMLSSTANSIELTKYYSGEFKTELLNVSQCLEETAKLCFSELAKNNCEFYRQIEPMIFLNMNYYRLSLAVLNLLINGFMYCEKTKKILTLKAYKQKDKVCIEVWDNGEKADCQALERSTQPFAGLKDFSQGESLGLSVVKKFVDCFNGELIFQKIPCVGLMVRMTFDDSIKELPQGFRLKRQPPLVGDFEPAYCILAKGLDLTK